MTHDAKAETAHKGALTKREQRQLATHAGRFCERCEKFHFRINNCHICALCLKCCGEMQALP